MEKPITLEEQLIRAHQKDLKMVQGVAIIVSIISFAFGIFVGIIIK